MHTLEETSPPPSRSCKGAVVGVILCSCDWIVDNLQLCNNTAFRLWIVLFFLLGYMYYSLSSILVLTFCIYVVQFQ